MLFVDSNEAQTLEFYVVFNQSVGADDELRFTVADALLNGGFFGSFQAADQEIHVISTAGENAARGEVMLHGKNFGGRHQDGLAAVFHGDYSSLQRDYRFAATHVSLK